MTETLVKHESHELSDCLFHLRRHFQEKFPAGGIVLESADADTLVKLLKEFGVMARNLENAVCRQRWNERMTEGTRPTSARAVLEEIGRPGSNVALFPIVPRPFSDGRTA